MSPLIANDAILAPLWRYWDTKRGRRRMPLRREIDPGEIPRLLPHLQLVDRVAGAGFRYRLCGSAIVQGYGFDATGKLTHEILTPERHRIASRHYALVFDSGRPLFARNRYVKDSFLIVMISRLILPLSLDGESVGMLLLGHTFAAPTAEEPSPGLDGVIDADEYEFLEGPPTLSLVPPLRAAAAR
ncbi:MAG: PAS domain-containing protein [Alphaproteobacteria bacterium]